MLVLHLHILQCDGETDMTLNYTIQVAIAKCSMDIPVYGRRTREIMVTSDMELATLHLIGTCS